MPSKKPKAPNALAKATNEHQAKIAKWESEINAADPFAKWLPNRFISFGWKTQEEYLAWLNHCAVDEYRLRRKG